MNSPSLLAGVILLLYLSDCLRFLDPGQALLLTRDGRHWRVCLGSAHWQLAGRAVVLANPFAPDAVGFVFRWRSADTASSPGWAADAPAAQDVAADLRPVGLLAWIAWALALIVLPCSLLVAAGPLPLLAGLALLYLDLLLCAALVYRRRTRLGLTGAAVGKLALECIFCAPFGVNMARKAALLAPVVTPAGADAAGWLAEPERAAFRGVIRARLAEELAEYDPGTGAHDRLAAELAHWTDTP
jgi:hypothetical protein